MQILQNLIKSDQYFGEKDHSTHDGRTGKATISVAQPGY